MPRLPKVSIFLPIRDDMKASGVGSARLPVLNNETALICLPGRGGLSGEPFVNILRIVSTSGSSGIYNVIFVSFLLVEQRPDTGAFIRTADYFG